MGRGEAEDRKARSGRTRGGQDARGGRRTSDEFLSRMGRRALASIWAWVALKAVFADSGRSGDPFFFAVLLTAAAICLVMLVFVRAGEKSQLRGGLRTPRRQSRIIADRRRDGLVVQGARRPSRRARIVRHPSLVVGQGGRRLAPERGAKRPARRGRIVGT
ncbi:MAG: hypothetical protein K0U74_08175 [Alphaproteobacteria bacterium]|nr:hypothetical protein [Alphaproteobacteria bacterium]